MAGVRGYCVAFLTAFDKHWNLALEDVREVWTRRKRNKVPALGKAVVRSVGNCSVRWYTLRAHALWSLKPLTQTLPTGWIRISNQFFNLTIQESKTDFQVEMTTRCSYSYVHVEM
jgi:hypothetical protein